MSDTQVEPESGKESRRKCRTHGRMHALVQDVSVWIHGHRLAVTLSCTFAGLNIAMWIGFALAGHPLPLRSLRTSLQEFNLLHLLATLLLTRGILQLLVDTIALLVMFSIAETLLGRRRTLTAAFICTLAGTALGLLLCGGIAQLLQGTPVVGRIRFALSPLTLGVGAMMAASAFTRRLWRRRIRLIGYVPIIMVVMFSGNPGDYCLLAAAGCGHVLGALASKWKTVRQLDAASAADPLHWQLSTSYETRRVFAAIALVLTLGPIIAISSPTHIGPLSSLGLIMSPASPDDGKLASCLAGMARTGCFFQFNLLRVSMPGAVLRSLLPTAVMLIMTWGLYRGRRLAAWAFIIVGLGGILHRDAVLFRGASVPRAAGVAFPAAARRDSGEHRQRAVANGVRHRRRLLHAPLPDPHGRGASAARQRGGRHRPGRLHRGVSGLRTVAPRRFPASGDMAWPDA